MTPGNKGQTVYTHTMRSRQEPARDTIIGKMQLTIAETETLNYYMAGLGFVEIAQMQNVNNTTVWRRRKSIQKKYLRYVVLQG